jgi:RNA binding exosome subunit
MEDKNKKDDWILTDLDTLLNMNIANLNGIREISEGLYGNTVQTIEKNGPREEPSNVVSYISNLHDIAVDTRRLIEDIKNRLF